jgi:signal transduction histidine kinase
MLRASQRFVMSFARKLSLLTGAVIAICLLVVLGVAYEALTRSAMSGASESLGRATRELASIAQNGIRQTQSRFGAVAKDPAVQRALARANATGGVVGTTTRDSTTDATERALAKLDVPSDSGALTELWGARGQRVAFVGSAEPVLPEDAGGAQTIGAPRVPRAGLEEVANADSLQIGRLYASGGRVYYWIVQPIIQQSKPIGYIAQQRRLSTNPAADRSIRALAGSGVTTYYHNTDGSLWTTVGGSPSSPPRIDPGDTTRGRRGPREEVLVASARIAGSPLDVAMESRVRDVLAVPRATIRELLIVGLLMLLAGMGAALLIGQRVARPIVAIADGAEAIARGQYDTRVPDGGDAEVARLADSFNHMANEVATAQRALEQKTADAQAASRAKSEFLATVSHELRTPLNAIAGYTELLEMGLRGPLTDSQRRDLARIRASGQHLLGLISGVLDLNRIERGQVTYKLVPIAIEPFLADLDALVSPQAATKSLSLEYVPSERALTVLADRERLRQVVLNLLSNAIRYTPAGGRIILSAAPMGDSRVAVRVQDNGPGIPENRREQVFEPFVQLDRSLTQTQEGLGLGLAISRDLARGMNGDLRIESGSGEGANFVLTLPRAPADQADEFTTSGEISAYGATGGLQAAGKGLRAGEPQRVE